METKQDQAKQDVSRKMIDFSSSAVQCSMRLTHGLTLKSPVGKEAVARSQNGGRRGAMQKNISRKKLIPR